MATELQSAIEENAEGPAEAHDDAGGVRQHSLRDQIEADKYLSRAQAASRSGLPIRFGKFRPPGAA